MRDDRDRFESKRWRSANQLSKELIGTPEKTNRMLTALRLALISDISEQAGIAWENAADIVEHHLIKRRGPHEKPGPKGPHATDDAVRLLTLELRTDVPNADPEWRSPNQLRARYMGALERIGAKVEAALDALVVDITAQTLLAEDEARTIVDRHFGGRRLPAAGGPIGLYASPRLVESLERDGVLRRRRTREDAIQSGALTRDEPRPGREK